MTLFGYTLRFLRGRKKLTLLELSRCLGIGVTTLENIENGYIQPEEDAARRIAEYFGVTVAYMKGCTELTLAQSGESSIHAPQRFVRLRPVTLPFSDAGVLQSEPATEILLPLPAGDRNEYVAIRATDNSFIRYRVMAGDTIIVRQDLLQIRDGELVFLCTEDGKTLLRRYFRHGAGVLLRSDDDDLLPPIFLSACDTKLRLVGAVAHIWIDTDEAFARRRAQNPPELPEELLPPPDLEALTASASPAGNTFDYGFKETKKK